MDIMFNLGPLPLGWECKIETKYGKIYFINHTTKSTTWDDPRLASIPTPPYHIAITQPTAYFEDTIGSRWSSPLPSLKGFSLHRRGSSPRLSGSPRIAPSPTPPPRNKRNEQVILESRTSTGVLPAVASASVLTNQQSLFPYPHGAKIVPTTIASTTTAPTIIPETIPERPNSRSSGCSSYYTTTHGTSTTTPSQHISTSHLVSCDPDTAYRTICAMFPSATEPHIRHLFHKYHNRPNLVVSALQVEKYPLASDLMQSQAETSPKNHSESNKDLDIDAILYVQGDNKSIGISSPARGPRSYMTDSSPARTGTPVSLMRFNSNNQSSVGSLFTKSWGSPILSLSPQMQMARESGKPPSKSPKMKLKYMKGIFPAADETILLDVLSSCENNVQRASDKLLKKGFTRTPPPKPARQKWLEVKSLIEKRQKALDSQKLVNFQHEIRGEPQESPFPTPIMKTARPHPTQQQKNDAKVELTNKFSNLPERFIEWALEVAQFQPEKAEQLLKEVYPQTPDEFKPFIVGMDEVAGTDEVEFKEGSDWRTPSEERVSLKERRSNEAEAEEIEDEQYNNNIVTDGQLDLETSKAIISKELGTPDSGYYELEQKPRKKGFLASLFHKKSAAEKAGATDKGFSLTSKKAKGPNPYLAKGSNPALIQKNYIQTHGPSQLRKGPNPSFRLGSQYQAKGPNPTLAQGPIWSSKINRYNAATNKPSVTFDVVARVGDDF